MKRPSTTEQQQQPSRRTTTTTTTMRGDFRGKTRAAPPPRTRMLTLVLAFFVAALATAGQASAFSRVSPPSSPPPPPPSTPPPSTPPPTPPPSPAPSAAPPSSPPPSVGGDDNDDDDGPFGLDQPCDASWNRTKAEYEANLEKWGAPDCYVFTIQRSCFCTDVVRNPAKVRVVNGTVVSPENYEELFLMPMEGLFDQVLDLCVKDCPERGAARCDIEYGPDGNLASAYIDRSEMIADEEISYTITDYRTCSGSRIRNRIRNRRLLRRPAH